MKKSLSILLMTLLMLLLAGCGGTDNGTEDDLPDTEDKTTETTTEEVTTEEAAAGGAATEEGTEEALEDTAEKAAEENQAETTEETAPEGTSGGSSASGPYEYNVVTNPVGEACIMNRLAAEYCDGVTMQEKFLAYHHLNFTNELPISPNIGCLRCMVDYSFAVMDGTQEPVGIEEMDTKGAPFTPELGTFMESYAYELANFFNGHQNRLMDYIGQGSPAMSYLDNNRASGNYADHTTHAVDVKNIEDMGDGTYKVTMYREYEHVTSNGIGSGTVEYTVQETPHAFEIIDFMAVDN